MWRCGGHGPEYEWEPDYAGLQRNGLEHGADGVGATLGVEHDLHGSGGRGADGGR